MSAADEKFVLAHDPERAPTREENEYAADFAILARVLESCPNGEDVALLLSTCRNQWMAANAAFVDVRLAVGRSAKSDPITDSIAQIRAGEFDRAQQNLQAAGEALAQAGTKLDVWTKRDTLQAQIDAAVEQLDRVDDQDRMRLYLADQREVLGKVSGRADSPYLSLDLSESSDGREVLDFLARVRMRASAVVFALRRLVEAERERTTGEGTLFPERADEAWDDFVAAVSASGREGRDPALRVLGIESLPARPAEREKLELTGMVLQSATDEVGAIRDKVGQKLRANTPRYAMPPPFVLDFTPQHVPLGDRGTPFTVEAGRGRVAPPPATATVALLSCGIPEAAYSKAELYQYERQERDDTGAIKRLGEVALRAAAESGAAFVVFPECFVPYDARSHLEDLVEELGLGLIAGVEHQYERTGRAVNEATVCVPSARAVSQRKQRPSVYEVRQAAFAGDQRLHVIEDTALGTLAVIVCSDYLELDLVWAVASNEPRIDTLVVCSRNPNDGVFRHLAIADAARMHMNVVIVNSRPEDSNEPPSGKGTLVITPSREQPELAAAGEIELESPWRDESVPRPRLLLFELPVAEISGRFKGRTKPTYLKAPEFATTRQERAGR